MGLFSRLKKDKKTADQQSAEVSVKQVKAEPAASSDKKADKQVEKKTAKPTEVKVAAKVVSPKAHDATVSNYAHRVLLKPMITEKSAHLHEANQYVFKVAQSANKAMIKQAIKEAYGVLPVKVNIISQSGKWVQRGRYVGQRSDYKKAIVILKKGESIKVYEGV